MRISFFPVVRTLHAWGGVTLALLFMLISFTGTLLVWKNEYLWLTVPQARVSFTPTPETLVPTVQAIDAGFATDDIIFINFASEQLPLTLLSLQDDVFAYLDTDGNIVARWTGNARFEEWLYNLHHRLLLGDFGLAVVGFAAMAMVLLLVAGIVSFWPRRRGWRLGLVPQNLTRVQLLKTHRNIGMVIALPFLLSLLTGITLVFPEQAEELLLKSVRSTQAYSEKMRLNLDDVSGPGTGDWLPAMQRAVAVFPGASIRSAQIANAYSSYRILGLQQAQDWNSTGMSKVYIDAYAGYMKIRIDAKALPAIEKLYNNAYPLHTAKLDQLWYKLLLTLCGVALFLVSGFGLLGFIRQYQKP